MNYKKITTNGYNLHMVKTDRFKNVYLKISLKERLNKKNITRRNMIVNILPLATKENPSRRKMEISSEELYNVGYSMGNVLSGRFNIMDLRGSFLNEKYTEKGMTEASLKFLFDIILNPFSKDGGFDQKIFNHAKEKLTDDINSFKDNPKRYAMLRLCQLINKHGPGSYNGFGYLEDLEKLDSKNLYRYYKKMIKDNILDIFVVGDIDFKEIADIVSRLYKYDRTPIENGTHYITYDKYRKKVLSVSEESTFTQSTLMIGFKIEDVSPYERQYVASIFSYILGGSADSRLFKSVRENNSLCYSIYSSIASVSSILSITAGIRKENFEKAVGLILSEVDKMQKGEISDEEIEQARLTYINSLKELEDSPSAIINMYVSREYINYDLLDDRFINIDKVSRDDIVAYANKLHLDSVFLLEGGNNNEEDASL